MIAASPMIRLLFLIGLSSCLSLLAASPKAPSKVKQDSSWKRYVNDELGYCVNYPSRWLRGDAFDGSGMYFATGVKKFTRPLGEIDLGAVPMEEAEQLKAVPVTAVEYLANHLDGLKRFERAQKLEVFDQREVQMFGVPALIAKDRYLDPIDNSSWVDEIILAKHGDTLFRFEMECKADQLARFEPVFSYFVQTFKFDCNAKR
jgi:hypothetical protein